MPSSDEVAHNLPVQLTSFVGRDAEIMQVRALLADSRLVTLTGAGGVGKTRLALQVAASVLTDYAAGVWLVELAPLTDAALIPVTVARAVGLSDVPGRSTMDTVTGFLGTRRVLLVLDNCEHLLDGSAVLVEELLRACLGLVILATSREPVGVAGEATWLVPSLPVAGAAVELFADRGRRARPGFSVTPENGEAVAEVCRRLDGIPLAIELAAARLRAFTPAEIAAGLHDRFRLLTGGSRTAARRQQTLQASVEWSHALLAEPERVLFRRLAVFAGGFDLDAAQPVVTGDGVQEDEVRGLLALLVDKSLVSAEESQEEATRYRLPETVRQYAAGKLADSGEAHEVRSRHRDYYTAIASHLDQPGGNDRRRLIRRLEADLDNLRAAFTWSMDLSDAESTLRLTSSLQQLWLDRSRTLEGLAWFEAALSGQRAGGEPIPLEVRVRAVADAAVLDTYTDNPLRHRAQAEDALALARQLGDPTVLGRALLGAGIAAGRLAEAGRPYMMEALTLARQANDPGMLAVIFARQAVAALIAGDPVAARSDAEEGLALAEQAGDDTTSRQCRQWLGWALFLLGDLRQARSVLTDLIAEAEAERLPFPKATGLSYLGQALAYLGEADAARQAGRAGITIAEEFGLKGLAAPGYGALVLAALASGDIDELRDATQVFRQHANVILDEFESEYHTCMAQARLASGDLAAARQHADQAVAAGLGLRFWLTDALTVSAAVAAAAGETARAHDEVCQALVIARDVESQIRIIDALECLGALVLAGEDQQKAARLLGAADALRLAIGYQRFRLHEPGYRAALTVLRAALGEQLFGEAWEEGAALSGAEAVSYALRGRGERGRPSAGWESLTSAEREVARLVGEGLSNKEIGGRLFISPRTVQTHLTHIYGKLDVTSRVQLAQHAARHAEASALP